MQTRLTRRGCTQRISRLLLHRLVALVREKLSNVLAQAADDAAQFTHVIDETVVFEMELSTGLFVVCVLLTT